MKKRLMILVLLVLGVSLVAACAPGGGTVKPADFYKGQTINFIISSRVGSGTDLVGRLMAPALKEYTGATVVIQNMEKVGSLEGINYVSVKAQPDGLTFGIVATGAMLPNDLLDLPGAEYDIEKLAWVGHVGQAPGTVLLVSPDGPYKSVKDLQAKKGLKFGTAAPQSSLSHGAAVAIKLLNLDAGIIPGFAGTGPIILSVQKGELDVWSVPIGAAMLFIQKGQMRPLLIVGEKRHALAPDVPAVGEIMTLTKEDKAFLGLIGQVEGYSIFAPPGTPRDRLEFLREAFDKAAAQPQFQQEVNKMFGHLPTIVKGEDIARKMEGLKKEKDAFKALGSLTESYLK